MSSTIVPKQLFEQTAEFARVQEEFWEASAATEAESLARLPGQPASRMYMSPAEGSTLVLLT